MRSTRALLVSLFVLSTRAAAAGTVTGTVEIAAGGKARTDASNVVVWIEGASRSGAGGAKTAQMAQTGKRFEPKVLAVAKNATVEFPNTDPVYHNVFSVSGSNRFDLGLYRSGATKSKKFEDAGVVRVYCNIHPQMVGFVLVVDSDYVAVTGPDGTFRFDNLPPGNYTLKVWSEESGESAQPVSVGAAPGAPVAVRLDATGFKAEPHKNKYGKDYPPNAGAADERY